MRHFLFSLLLILWGTSCFPPLSYAQKAQVIDLSSLLEEEIEEEEEVNEVPDEPDTKEAQQILDEVTKDPPKKPPKEKDYITKYRPGDRIKIIRQVEGPNENLRLMAYELEVLFVKDKEGRILKSKYPYVEVRGQIEKTDKLVIQSKKAILSKEKLRNFKHKIELKESFVDFTAMDLEGDLRIERMTIERLAFLQRPPDYSASLGVTQLAYKETISAYGTTIEEEYNALMLTGKVAFTYRLSDPNWDIAGNAFMNLMPIQSDRADVEARVLGINVRLGRQFRVLPEPWGFKLGLGLFYSRMFVTDNMFGYNSIIYPQVFPVVFRGLGNGRSIYIYGKWTFLQEGFTPSTEQREIAMGTGYTFRLKNKHMLTISLDYSDVFFYPDEYSEISSNTISFGVGYSL